MSAMSWVMISIAFLIIVMLFVFLFLHKRGKTPPTDYYNLFIIGVIWVFFGLFFDGLEFFFVIGIAFMIAGMVKKDKWKTNHRTWKQLGKSERKMKAWFMALLTILLIAGAVALVLTKNGIV